MSLAVLKTLCFTGLSLALFACQAQSFGSLPLQSARIEAQAQADWRQLFESQSQQIFAEHDLNRNGSIELREIPHAPASFQELDTNQDGHLSSQEALPKSAYFDYLKEYVRKNLTPLSSAESRQDPAQDPQLETLPTPAEMQRFDQELKQAATQSKALDRPPVLLVPGYAEPSWYFMYGIYRQLKKEGWQVEGINLFPNFASAEEQAHKVKAKIEEMKQRYGVQQVDLVVHSFGGLISRYYIQELQGKSTVRNLVTVATPHHGTVTAFAGPGKSAQQLRPNSAFLTQLNANGFAYAPVKYTSIWSNLDEIVIPPKNAIMPDSKVYYVPWTGHLTIMFSKRTYAHILETLRQ